MASVSFLAIDTTKMIARTGYWRIPRSQFLRSLVMAADHATVVHPPPVLEPLGLLVARYEHGFGDGGRHVALEHILLRLAQHAG